MADVIDIANDHADYLLQLALDNRQRGIAGAVSAVECEDCGDSIPELRRIAIRGCETCVSCQAHRERRR